MPCLQVHRRWRLPQRTLPRSGRGTHSEATANYCKLLETIVLHQSKVGLQRTDAVLTTEPHGAAHGLTKQYLPDMLTLADIWACSGLRAGCRSTDHSRYTAASPRSPRRHEPFILHGVTYHQQLSVVALSRRHLQQQRQRCHGRAYAVYSYRGGEPAQVQLLDRSSEPL